MENLDKEDWAFGGDGEEMSDLLNVGDNFVVPTETNNEEGMIFISYNAKFQNSRLLNHLSEFGDVNLMHVIMLLEKLVSPLCF